MTDVYEELDPKLTEQASAPIEPSEKAIEAAMRKITVLKMCGERPGPCTNKPDQCECWRAATAGVKVLLGL